MNLKQIRTEKGMTQDELAAALNITRQRLSNYELDKREPPLELLKNLAAALDCTVDELLAEPENENV